MRRFLRFLIRFLINLIADVTISGYEYLPQGSFVIASNHLGFLDVLLLFYAIDRPDMFIPVAEKWEKVALFRWLSKPLNLVFIDRFNPDIKALRKILHLMEKGNILVIAPEGTRSRTETMAEGKPGVAYLAAKLERPIVPVGLYGTEDRKVLDNLKHFRRSKIVVRAGPAFRLAPLPARQRDQALREYTDEIMCRIAVLLPEKYRGVYRQHPRLQELLEEGSAAA
uniref:1-acyl-sn-glycerol-3-phosphate acyltransferase n=1 Tax=uncultured Chloroflexota bacterium TaxID=166587 RepID=H5SPF9_9CHLR|nr:1-acyl-sn-glycerol-3-phosphate acyltransferase [uncultured Chloroflexota bacterium]BAL58045.1 1-acyl-sn-glycerol-3-phosphate acyltransferase [uncultured Chloroflexota bacterium]